MRCARLTGGVSIVRLFRGKVIIKYSLGTFKKGLSKTEWKEIIKSKDFKNFPQLLYVYFNKYKNLQINSWAVFTSDETFVANKQKITNNL